MVQNRTYMYTNYRLPIFDILWLLTPPCSKLLLILPSSPVDNAKPPFSEELDFFESNENALPTGMLRRLIHPLGFSGRRLIGGSGGRKSWGEGFFRVLYLDAEQVAQPQKSA